MSPEFSSHSEVATLLAQIQREYEAGRRALYDVALGTSQHQFITTRMERIGELHQELHGLLGEDAIALVAQTLEGNPATQHGTETLADQETEKDKDVRNHATDPIN